MPLFVQLTTTEFENHGRLVWINMAQVISMSPLDSGDTLLKTEQRGIFVTETPATILALLAAAGDAHGR